MPLYEFKCSKCNNKFEELRPLSRSAEDSDCPICKAPAKRIMSVFAAVTKDNNGATTSLGNSSCADYGSASGCTSS